MLASMITRYFHVSYTWHEANSPVGTGSCTIRCTGATSPDMVKAWEKWIISDLLKKTSKDGDVTICFFQELESGDGFRGT